MRAVPILAVLFIFVPVFHVGFVPAAIALTLLGISRLDAPAIDRTLGSVLKYREDQDVIRGAGLERLVS